VDASTGKVRVAVDRALLPPRRGGSPPRRRFQGEDEARLESACLLRQPRGDDGRRRSREGAARGRGPRAILGGALGGRELETRAEGGSSLSIVRADGSPQERTRAARSCRHDGQVGRHPFFVEREPARGTSVPSVSATARSASAARFSAALRCRCRPPGSARTALRANPMAKRSRRRPRAGPRESVDELVAGLRFEHEDGSVRGVAQCVGHVPASCPESYSCPASLPRRE